MQTTPRRLAPPVPPTPAARAAGFAWAGGAGALLWAGLMIGLDRSGVFPPWLHAAGGAVVLAFAAGALAVAAGDLLPRRFLPVGRAPRVGLVAAAPPVAVLLAAVLFALAHDPYALP